MGKPLRALIIEDSEDDTQLLLRELRDIGYEVEFESVETDDAMEAVLTEKTWDLILSDYTMPKFSALQALEVLKASRLDLPFIIISGTIGEETAVATLKAGAHDFLIKGNFARLGPVIEQELREAQSRRERRQAEQALQTSEELFGTAFHHSPVGICITTLDGRLQNVSQSLVDMLGFARTELEGKHFNDITHPDDLEIEGDAVSRMMSGKIPSVSFEKRYLHKTGEPVWALVSSSLLRDASGQPVHFITHILNITERKHAEDAVHESETRYHDLFENSPISLWEEDFSLVKQRLDALRQQGADFRDYFASHPQVVTELAGLVRVTDVNRAALELYKAKEKKELLGSLLEVVHKSTLEHFQDELLSLMSAQASFAWEGTDTTLNGEQIQVSVQYSIPEAHLENWSKIIFAIQDITPRKHAEEMLKEERNLLRTLIDNLPDRIFVMNTQGRKTLSNTADWRASGGETMEDVLGKTDFDTYPPELAEEFWALDKAVLDSGEPVINYEEPGLDAEGNPVWVLSTKVPLRDSEGKVTGLVGIGRDLTERKHAEAELRASEERFRQLADNIQEAFWITDAESGKEIYLSPAAETIWGRPLEELMHEPYAFMENILPEDQPKVLDALEKQRNGQKTEIEYRITRPDGSVHWIWDRSFPILDGSGRASSVAGITADITEGKQAEAEIRHHLIELEALYENGLAVGRLLEPREIGEQIIETFSRHLSWHHVTIRLRRHESDDLELIAFNLPHMDGKKSADAERNFISHVKKVGEGMSGWVVQTGKSLRTGNLHEHAQYVHTFEGMQSGLYMPLKIADRVIGVISVESEKDDAFTAQDERLLATLANQAAVAFENARLYHSTQQELSERMRAEELLEHERNLLAQRVAERTSDLSRANSNLARALRVKDEFLANMSHELRTPLNAILGLSESLGEQIAGPLNEKQMKYITTISESGHHLLSLINDILDLAKIEAGQITLDINKVDVNSVCQASLRMIKQLAQKKNQDVTLEIDDGISLMWADERRLKQMIVNLLGNAVKFTPEDGSIGLEVHGNRDENKVAITVWDNGIGIKESDLPQLFQPFVQLDAGIARGASGTGLGLALVAQMARLHGGSVSASGQPGKGSRFTIVLPWEPALAADTESRLKSTGKFRAVDPNAENKRTILLIEDTEEVIMMLRDYLELAGYKVLTAQDGLDGITQAKLHQPDLILMDIQMPHMDGFEATQRLRNDPEFKYTPIIALTALAMSNDRERCLAAGMDEYISKPVNLKALVKIIQGCLSKIEETRS